MLLLWPGEVRRKREDDSGRTGPALFAGTNNQSWVNYFFLPMPHLRILAEKFNKILTKLSKFNI